ncbi:unnamed protein product (mitochondrion) [Plasmodiophora brassicae]|uniref:C2H2-type domain-containing protein n=1 Tax=Plasmodiophora brassicae TaxID=37360 RepID=A0A0G4IHM3_PLABS|nr:hypothetical protein PBRA_000352 [Plasmodiophora brassicae]SPQ96913.1 unnamed protein product [Plasmodiophora brassicae]
MEAVVPMAGSTAALVKKEGRDETGGAQALLTLASTSAAASPDLKPTPTPISPPPIIPGEPQSEPTVAMSGIPCPICHKEFPKLADMKRHKRAHTGERTFNCETCDKAFLKASDLKRHTRIHTGERPYRCVTCGRAFAEGGSLQRHTRMHTGERPYACSVCDKRFVRSYNAKKHMKMHKDCNPEIINLGKPGKMVKRAAAAASAARIGEPAGGPAAQRMMMVNAVTEIIKREAVKRHSIPPIKPDSSPWLYQSVSTPPAGNSPKSARSPIIQSPTGATSAFAAVMSPMSIPAPMVMPVSAELLASGITARILQH